MKSGTLRPNLGTLQSLGQLGKSNVSTFQSMTSKTIAPSPYDLPPPDLRRQRKIHETSAWTPGQIFIRDFETQQRESYMNPSVHLAHMNAEDEALAAERQKWAQGRQEVRKVALEKLAGVARLKYGNMANMLRAFKKNTGDTITLPEFAEHLRRRNMDSMLPLEDQELVWEQLKATARGSVDVANLSKAVDETLGDDKLDEYNKDKRDMIELRNFLKAEVTKKRDEQGVDSSAPQLNAGGLAGEDDKVKNALGQKTFDLDIGAEEMDSVVEGLFQKKHTKESHEKFSRFLRLTNVKLHAIPFYDLRSDELARLKQNAKKLSVELVSPEMTEQLHNLKKSRQILCEEDLKNSRVWKAEEEARQEAKFAPFVTSPIRTKPGSQMKHSASESALDSELRSPIASSRTNNNSSSVISTTESYGERAFEAPSPIPESTATAIFGDSDPSMYNSTYSEYYPPLNYEPNKPITRNNVSDADKKCRIRNMRRQLRQKRTEANTKLTKDRLDLERLSALNKQLKGEHSRTEDMIRYQTTVFLHDLKCYKKQPLQTMAKKPNLTKSDAMWGGSQKFDSATEARESRDFRTTFTSSYNPNPPRSGPNIDIEARVAHMGFK